MISEYPDFTELTPALRPLLHPLFQNLTEGISEFTFAGLYLFRETHHYRVSRLGEGQFAIAGSDGDAASQDAASREAASQSGSFFMLPFGLPSSEALDHLFDRFGRMKAVSETLAGELTARGYRVEEDRDSFDYLYAREEMVGLAGRKFHKKKNLVNAFARNYRAEGRPLLQDYLGEALAVLDAWRGERDERDPGDYVAAREALERMDELQLCGGIYYVEGRPAAYSLGEEIARGKMFAIHFEKAVRAAEYKGIYQFINQTFASILPPKYETINREQDLGDLGLRQAKESYNPVGFVRKYVARKS